MNSLVNIALRTEFSFKETFGRVDNIATYANGALGVADLANTYSHIPLEKLSKKHEFKPLYGVRLEVVKDDLIKVRGSNGAVYIFIAKNQDGLIEIYNLVRLAYDLFYYKPHISFSALLDVSKNVIVIAEGFEAKDRIDYLALTPSTSPLLYSAAKEFSIPCVYVNNNNYSTIQDRGVYQLIAGTRKHGDEYLYNFDSRSYPQHILNQYEFARFWKDKDAVKNSQLIADQCEQFDLKKAPMVSYDGARSIEKWCARGAKELGINLKVGEYAERYEREMILINEKQYTDYFLIVAEIIEKAKSKMLVGCARGCFLPDQNVNIKTPQGSKKVHIQDAKIGQKIKTPMGQYKEIEDVFAYDIEEEIFEIEFDDGRILKCTKDHEILTHRGFVKACNLTLEDNVCDINSNSMQLSKLTNSGWPVHLAHKVIDIGWIDWDDLVLIKESNSKKHVKFKCLICEKDSLSKMCDLSSRTTSLRMQPVCPLCASKTASGLPESKLNNSKAQKISQNKLEQKCKNAVSVSKSALAQTKYNLKFNFKEWRNEIFEIWDNKCADCDSQKSLNIHHIDKNDNKNSNFGNIIVLCSGCHTSFHNHERYNPTLAEELKQSHIKISLKKGEECDSYQIDKIASLLR